MRALLLISLILLLSSHHLEANEPVVITSDDFAEWPGWFSDIGSPWNEARVGEKTLFRFLEPQAPTNSYEVLENGEVAIHPEYKDPSHQFLFLREKSGCLEYRVTFLPDFNKPIKRPRVYVPAEPGDLVIWPHGEGVMFEASDPFWSEEIDFSHAETISDALSLPVWGLIRDGYTLSCIMDFIYDAESLETEYLYRYYLDEGTDPLQPALHYRAYLKETRKFKSLTEKARRTPNVDLLRGAPHAYLWGSDPISWHDIKKDQWKPFCETLLADGDTEGTIAHALRQHFNNEQWAAVKECATAEWPSRYAKKQVTAGLSNALRDPQLIVSNDAWEAIKSVEQKDEPKLNDFLHGESLDHIALIQFYNALFFRRAFPKIFLECMDWGNGVSFKMLEALNGAGLNHLKLCTEGIQLDSLRPWIASRAKKMGLLYGTYDSYHSIHNPAIAGTDKTWETAQMTPKLWDDSTIKNCKGEYIKGFKGVGRKLNSIEGRNFFGERISSNISVVPYNYYFIDCDATGELFDDYSTGHQLTIEGDAAERRDRLEWIAETFDAVVGSEGGIGYFAPSIHVGEGIFGPYFGWDDSDMKDRDSEYFRGRYYPPDAPEINFKPIPLKERFKKLHYDPAHRIPLYAAALHDSVVVTHHWNNAHFKYPEVRPYVALTEVLYLAPPMYHFNLEEFAKRRDLVMEHYEVWSPLHRAFGFAPLASFKHLTDDRLVQETRYIAPANEASDASSGQITCRILVNYRDSPYEFDGLAIPSMSAWIEATSVWPQPRIYTPTPAAQ